MVATRSVVSIMLNLAIASLGVSSPAVPPDLSETERNVVKLLYDDKVRQLSPEQEKAMALLLRRHTNIYQQKIKAIGPLSFEGRKSMSPVQATMLLEEGRALASNLDLLLQALGLIPDSPDHTSAGAWLLAAASLSGNGDHMADLKNAGLVDSNWPTLVRLILPGMFTKILHPKIMVLMEKSKCGAIN